MAKYQADVQTLLRAIGGRENIQAESHCMTRMRFVLADPGKQDTPGLQANAALQGTFTQEGPYQLLTGQHRTRTRNECPPCAVTAARLTTAV